MKLIVMGTGVVAATGLSMALFGTGVAAADDYAGRDLWRCVVGRR